MVHGVKTQHFFRWKSMKIHWQPLMSMKVHGFPPKKMLRFNLMDIHESPWNTTNIHGFPWPISSRLFEVQKKLKWSPFSVLCFFCTACRHGLSKFLAFPYMRGKVGQLNILTCQISYPYFQRFGLASVHRPTDKQTNKLTVLTISITLTAYVQYSVMCQGSEVSSENQLQPTCRRMTVPKTWYHNELNMINPCN